MPPYSEELKVALAQLTAGNNLAGLTIFLADNNSGDEGAEAIATALTLGNCSAGFTLYLRNNNRPLA